MIQILMFKPPNLFKNGKYLLLDKLEKLPFISIKST